MATWLLAYDIGDSRHRRHCRRVLRGLAEGYQKSVFEIVSRPEDIRTVLDDLAVTLAGHDSLLAAKVLPFQHGWQLGRGYLAPAGDLIIVS